MLRVILTIITVVALVLGQDIEGPPKLKRGRPTGERQSTSTSEAARERVVVPREEPAAAEAAAPEQPAVESTGGEFLGRAREAAANFTGYLPNFLCQESVTRYVSSGRPINWRVQDRMSLDVVFEGGKETYRNIKVGNKAVKSLEETGGAWSTGGFGSLMANLFDPRTEAVFEPDGSERMAGREAKRYRFTVARENSAWDLTAEDEMLRVGYKGTVWLDADSARVLRIEMQAEKIPRDYPFDMAEWSLDYGYTRIGGSEYLVPVEQEILSCSRGTSDCFRNATQYRNYRRFTGESSITFE